MTVLMDLALTTERVGESMMDKASLHEFGLLDEEESKKYLNGQDSSKPDYLEHICRPASGTRNIEVVDVDMTDFYTRMGTTMYNPAFREFALAPLHWLHTPDNEAEAYIAARLSLTYEQRIQAERVIRISHNHAKLSRLLSADQLPLPYERMIALCRAISTR
jgi:hypothetical protein